MISIAMCSYNGDKYIKEQINSILNQTYSDFELVVTDDGSTDNTLRIIKEYQLQDDRIKLYENKKNLGFVKNFEKAISLCQGDYIALADQDDIWKLNKLEILIRQIGKNVLIYSDAILIDESSNETGNRLINPKKQFVSGKCNKSLLLYNCISGNTLMFKNELIEHILPIPNSIKFHDVWIAFVASTYGEITYTELPLTLYRRYTQQITHTRKSEYKSIMDRLSTKNKLYLDNAQAKISELESYLSLNILEDKETIIIIKMLIEHYKNFESTFFNIELFELLKYHLNDVFAINKKNKRYKELIKATMGLKLNKLLLYTF